MKKPKDPRELTIALLSRSICSVRVAAVLADAWGIYSWGTNHMGFDGLGEHAEVACLRHTNRARAASGSTLYIAASRRRNARTVTAKPCERCQQWIQALGIGEVCFREKDGVWAVKRMDKH